MSEPTKTIVDGLSIGTALGSLAGMLPAIAALFTIVWTGIRIYETKTVSGWVKRMKSRKE